MIQNEIYLLLNISLKPQAAILLFAAVLLLLQPMQIEEVDPVFQIGGINYFALLQAESELQRATVKFQRANSLYKAAKETVALAEEGKTTAQGEEDVEFDSAWQEMMNHATMRVRSASHHNWCTVGGCRVGEVRAGTTSPMPTISIIRCWSFVGFKVYYSLPYVHVLIGCVWCEERERKEGIGRKKSVCDKWQKTKELIEWKVKAKPEIDVSMALHIIRWQFYV